MDGGTPQSSRPHADRQRRGHAASLVPAPPVSSNQGFGSQNSPHSTLSTGPGGFLRKRGRAASSGSGGPTRDPARSPRVLWWVHHVPALKAAREAARHQNGSKGARSRDPRARPAVPHLGALQDALAGKTRGARVGVGHRPRTGRATTNTEALLEQRPSKGAAADTDQQGSVSEWGLETTRTHPDQHREQVGLK